MKPCCHLPALALALVLTYTPALAAEADGAVPVLTSAGADLLLPAVNAYTGFADVSEDDWYYQGVRTCVESGLMNGTGEGVFTPGGVMTVSEAAAIAARLRETITGEAIPAPVPDPSRPWYDPYVSYLTQNGVAVPDPTAASTRTQFFGLLAAVATDELLAPVNAIDALPDVDAGDPVLDFYNAGILTGVDEDGTFAGDRTLTRAECAAMVARLADPSQRKVGVVPTTPGRPGVDEPTPSATPAPSPAPEPPAPSTAPGQSADGSATVLTVNGQAVSRDEFVGMLNGLIYDVDYNLYRQGTRLDWTADYGVGNLKKFFLDQAVSSAVRGAVLDAQAAALGCTAEELPAKRFPDPGYAVLSAYAQENDYLCAKHVLVNDTDTAKAVLDGLEAVPTLEQMNALITVFGVDPGMEANPDGYLFTANEMVPQFEAGTRALSIGSYSKEPVQSEFGYHIIWRLDPATHPGLLVQYQYGKTLELLDQQAQQAQVELDQAVLSGIDPQSCYAEFLAQ